MEKIRKDVIEEYSDPCDACIHRINAYCRAYKVKIELISVGACIRRKTEKRD